MRQVSDEIRALTERLCEEHPAISTYEGIFGGIPHLKGQRIAVADILEQLYLTGSISGVQRVYRQALRREDFNKIIEIKEREAHRVKILMEQVNQNEKTLVFCATQAHALAVRDLINQMKTSTDPNYCQRVTANDGELGEQHLRDFQDNEKTIPTILTSSQKLSTGEVDLDSLTRQFWSRPRFPSDRVRSGAPVGEVP